MYKEKRKIQYFIKILGLLLFFILSAIILKRVSDICQRKDSDNKYHDFFEQKEDFDVLFLGTSHVINAIYPMELYQNYGIISYNFGGHSNELATSYWVMRNALDYTTPKLVVVDILEVGSNQKMTGWVEQSHLSLDCFPISRTKVLTVLDLFDDPTAIDVDGKNMYDIRWEWLLDFGKYHSRWNELTESDFENEDFQTEKGAEFRIDVVEPLKYRKISADSVLSENTIGQEYLCKIIEECHKRGIEVLLIKIPHPASEKEQMEANTVYEIARRYDVKYLNFLEIEDVVNYDTDCYDDYSHLNPSGGKKVTDYLGTYIMKTYEIPDQRQNPDYYGWQEDYQEYLSYKISKIVSEKDLYNYLMLLADKDFLINIEINDDSILSDVTVQNLLDNLIDYGGVFLH